MTKIKNGIREYLYVIRSTRYVWGIALLLTLRDVFYVSSIYGYFLYVLRNVAFTLVVVFGTFAWSEIISRSSKIVETMNYMLVSFVLTLGLIIFMDAGMLSFFGYEASSKPDIGQLLIKILNYHIGVVVVQIIGYFYVKKKNKKFDMFG